MTQSIVIQPQLLAGSSTLPVVLRPMEASDRPFVTDSWLMSFARSAIARDAGAAYKHDYKWLIRRWLDRAAVLVAADPEEPGAIWGWAATRGTTVLYVYVRQEFRRQGIAKMLLAPFLPYEVTYCAKAHHTIPVPAGWRYSFLAAVRIACE